MTEYIVKLEDDSVALMETTGYQKDLIVAATDTHSTMKCGGRFSFDDFLKSDFYISSCICECNMGEMTVRIYESNIIGYQVITKHSSEPEFVIRHRNCNAQDAMNALAWYSQTSG